MRIPSIRIDSEWTTADRETLAQWLDPLASAVFNWRSAEVEKSRSLGPSLFARDSVNQIQAFVVSQSTPDRLEILCLATRPQFREKGLMEELLGAFFAQHQKGREVWLEVHEFNTPARKLYEKIGMRAVGERPRYYRDGATAILYSLSPT